MAESDRLLSDCTPFKGVPRVQIPLSPPIIFENYVNAINVLLTASSSIISIFSAHGSAG